MCRVAISDTVAVGLRHLLASTEVDRAADGLWSRLSWTWVAQFAASLVGLGIWGVMAQESVIEEISDGTLLADSAFDSIVFFVCMRGDAAANRPHEGLRTGLEARHGSPEEKLCSGPILSSRYMSRTDVASVPESPEASVMTDKPSTRWWLRTDRAEVVIDAPAQDVYDLIADMPRMGEWSPECTAVEWTGDSAAPEVGATFIGHNVGGPRGLMKWSRSGTVRTARRGEEFAFSTSEGGHEGVLWRYELEPVSGGTRVRESYRVDRIPAWARIVDVPTNRARELRESMEHTLEQLKTAAETSSPA